ncbi:PREDICTED: uncharacterized protein LOC106810992 [Priapulus caudatus]|uniref:Uncharacterized protein LOC106810992 n=1 Tax=Priapulus caudatus TaxID=37621 RepID=A0ABM1ECR3_PRICU|nr:PREDICTED: uncharacterized protein LOC106810992 [Priapulus caudatus]
MGALTKISALMADIGGLKMEIGASLYKACIRPLLEFAYPVWCCAPIDQILKLERVQRIALLRASGTLNSTPTAALEVMTNVPPLRIRYEEILAQEFIRIHRKPHTNHLRSMVLQHLDDRSYMDHRILTPLHQIKMAVKDLCREFDPRRVDHELVYLTERMHSSIVIRATNTWQTLGNSKTRTSIQASAARKITQQQNSETDNNWIIAFTDGSALGNPGPCGASAIIYANGMDSEPSSIRKAVSKKSSSYHGEIYAIYLAVDFTVNYSTTHHIAGIRIFSDCQSAILTVSNSTQHNNFTSLCSDILERVQQLYDKEIDVDICWVAGHAGLAANELACAETKIAAHEAADIEDAEHQAPLSLLEAKGETRKAVIRKWQHRWDISETGRTYYQNKPSVTVKSVRSKQYR